MASNSRSAMRAASARAASAGELHAELERDAELGGEAAAGFLDARDAARRRRRQTSRAPTSSAVSSTTSPSTQTAIFEVPPPTSTFITVASSRIERAAAPEPCAAMHGFEAVAGADRDHLAGLAREQLADRARVAPAHRDAGEDQRAGVDLVGIDVGVLVLALDEGAERLGVDVLGRPHRA